MDPELYVIVDPKGFWCREATLKRGIAILISMGSIPERIYYFKIKGVKPEHNHHFWFNGIDLIGLPGYDIETHKAELPREKLEQMSELMSDLDDYLCPDESE